MLYSRSILSLSLLIVFFGVTPVTSTAQDAGQRANTDNLLRGNSVIITSPLRATGVVGSPYFSDAWLAADIQLNNGQVLEEVRSRYNVWSDAIEVVHRADTLQLSEVLVRGFTFIMPGGHEVSFQNRVGVMPGEFGRNAYLQVLYEGEHAGVFKRHTKVIREAQQGASGFGFVERHDSIESREMLLFQDADGEFHRVRLNRRNVLRLFGDHDSDIRAYARQHNLDFRSESDFIRMVQQYNSLL
ncbi:hypothetical protein CYPRO_0943 [Cyclonatronum proteinivorum]|uniref:Uncharacterized protein n=1 Tax=Cyclonatronum proteinivorum TaxID=1457365 RepID=A0A345UIB8_9BACT|nr:hypothetical protein [Cyclonatronum proteinivorum]AXJ00220.1 hypothetical protein CYPRO_0943 [Cyclonatronum proteinivorum]